LDFPRNSPKTWGEFENGKSQQKPTQQTEVIKVITLYANIPMTFQFSRRLGMIPLTNHPSQTGTIYPAKM
jgi:hypothetical protein